MNERIKELAIEAGAISIHDPDRPNEEPLLRLKHLGIEKFAELIVRDCVEICYGLQLRSGWIAPRACGDDILKHFGIEE